MRRLLVALIAAAAASLLLDPAALAAQGWITVPCEAPPPPPPCPPGAPCRTPPIVPPCPAPAMSPVVRTASIVHARLEGRVVHWEIDERFVNRGGRLAEADYLFPLPHGAAFQDLELSVNGELVAGETMDADRARSIYETIVRQRRDPALVEWMGYGLLRARIFPINPGEEKRVVVRFTQVAPREGDALRIDYVRGTAPAAQPPVVRPLPVDDPNAGARGDDGSRFTLDYPDSAGYGSPYSPTHALVLRREGSRRVVEVRGDARDVTILLPVRRSREPSITVLAHDDGSEDGFALIALSPPEMRGPATPRDVTFVLDVSGSMRGRKMEQARAAGRQLLATLRPQDRFRLIDFSSDVRTFRDDFVPATERNVDAAERYLGQLDADGGTNIAGALDEALRPAPAEGRLSVVLFITDGEPTVGETRPDAIEALAKRERGDRRLFTFGLGADVNVPLIEQLALDGRGTAQFVRPDEDVERMVGIVASRLRDPVMTDVRVRADGVRLLQLYPVAPVDIFAGEDLVLLARYRGHGEARVSFDGDTPSGHATWSTTFDFPDRERANGFIARLWATQRVGWLSAERRKSGASPELDAELKALGLKYGIPTELSSYLVQEPSAVAVRGVRTTAPMGMVGAVPMAAPAPARAQAFEAAKAASQMRASTSLADAASAAGSAGANAAATIRHAGARTFVLRDGVWTDTRWHAGMPVLRIRAFTPGYFTLLRELPELRDALAIGDRVRAAGRAIAVEVADDGADRLTTEQVAALRRDW